MKVCETCGDRIDTRDGYNKCASCEDDHRPHKAIACMKDDVMRSLGLVKVRGAMGGVYWE